MNWMKEIISTEIEKGVIIKLSDGTIIKGAKRNQSTNESEIKEKLN